jgi:hypothetical protein
MTRKRIKFFVIEVIFALALHACLSPRQPPTSQRLQRDASATIGTTRRAPQDSMIQIIKLYDSYLIKPIKIHLVALPFEVKSSLEYFSKEDVRHDYDLATDSRLNYFIFDEERKIREQNDLKRFEGISIPEIKIIYHKQNICRSRSRDITSSVACFERFRKRMEVEANGPGITIEGLIFSENYSTLRNEFPAFLLGYLDNSLKKALEALDLEKKTLLSGVKLWPSENNQYSLWVESMANEKIIHISPALIRAAFCMSIFRNSATFRQYYDSYVSEGKLPPRAETHKLRLDVKSLMSQFESAFNFVIAHELAHMYVNARGLPQLVVEKVCDCNAFVTLIKSNPYQENLLGAFKDILEESIKNKLESAWGLEDAEDLNVRFVSLSAYKLETNCELEVMRN